MSATVPPSDRQMLGFRTAAEAIEGNDDLLSKVLLLIPVRPLFRFKLVSKRWLSLISNPLFASIWRPQQVLPSALILQSYLTEGPCCFPLNGNSNFKASSTFLDYLKDSAIGGDSIEIFSSCDGLILCTCGFKYKVCNPTTKQFTTLPPPSTQYHYNLQDGILAFDHSLSLHYKVVFVGPLFGNIDIYSSQTNSWSLFCAKFPIEFHGVLCEGKGVFFKGAIYWTFSKLNRFCCLDLDTEILHTDYPMPPMNVKYYCGCLNENLYLVGSDREVTDWGGQVDVFELGIDRSSWSLKYRIDLCKIAGHAFHQKSYDTRNPGEYIKYGLHSVILTSEEDEEPYLALYLPCQAELIRYWNKRLELPSAHHLIENPFWVGSIDNK